jgi:hypothetical protein
MMDSVDVRAVISKIVSAKREEAAEALVVAARLADHHASSRWAGYISALEDWMPALEALAAQYVISRE